MAKLLKRLLWLLTILAIIPLLLAYLATRVSPAVWWPLAYFGLLYPVWLLINAVIFILWLFVKPRIALVQVIMVLLGWGHLRHVIGFHIWSQPETTEGIRLITYNVHNFDFYNWKDNQTVRHQIFDFLDDRQPDILCLQEYFTMPGDEHDNQGVLQQQLGLKYHHFYRTTQVKTQEYGQAMFSRYPMVRKGVISFPHSRNGCIWADLVIKGDTIRVFNVHLQSIFLQEDEKEAVGRAIREQEADPEESRRVLGKLKQGFIKRAGQADTVGRAIRTSPYPVIVCGDFNDTPVSYAYHQLQKGLQDAFTKKGSIIGSTFAGSIPWLRIDYVLVDKSMEVEAYRRHQVHYSDHFPVEVWVAPSSFP